MPPSVDSESRTGANLSHFSICYQIVSTSETRILPSLLISGTPRHTAVAAMTRSGRSGT